MKALVKSKSQPGLWMEDVAPRRTTRRDRRRHYRGRPNSGFRGCLPRAVPGLESGICATGAASALPHRNICHRSSRCNAIAIGKGAG